MSKRKKESSFRKQATVAGGVLVLLLAAHGTKGHGHGILAELDSIGHSNLSTRGGWARAFLAKDGMPETRCDKVAVRAWMNAEGGGFGNQAANNPLNLNPGAGAGWPGHNAIGAWAFPDAATGLRYTVATVQNYGGIQAALRAGNDAQAVLTAVENSPWAGSHYGYRLSAPPC